MLEHDIINIVLAIYLLYQTYIYLELDKMENSDGDYWRRLYEAKMKDDYLLQRDYGVVYNPLAPPEQRVESQQYPYPQVLFNERTRGEPDNYQMVGLLYNTDKNKQFQLYGRRVYPGSPDWEYYLRGMDEGGLDTKLPIAFEQGQYTQYPELLNGQQINIPYDTDPYTVTIYQNEQYRYNPFPYTLV
jgi:hypothetical protein